MNRRVPPPVTTNGPMPMDEEKRIQIGPLFLLCRAAGVFHIDQFEFIQYHTDSYCCYVWVLGFSKLFFSYPLGMIPANIFLS